MERWTEAGIAALPYTDARYPDRLLRTAAAPSLLFVRGQLTPGDGEGIALIGSRRPGAPSLASAAELAAELAAAGRTVISGLAAGIDGAAHRAALDAGGRSIAVLGNGLNHTYPREHRFLQGRMTVLVSQFHPDAPPSPRSFPQRNAVMSGLSAATVVIEAGERSGARIQARQAVAQGRPLFLLPGVLDQSWAQELVDAGVATALASPADVLERIL